MLNRWSYQQVPRLRRLYTRLTYELISLFDRDVQVPFMNCGYAELDQEVVPLPLPAEQEPNRYQIQLYHRVGELIDWTGLDALEVSCGRGGGAEYIMRRFRPASLTGVDFSSGAIAFCQSHYRLDGLSFMRGDAESLCFPDESFDVILNVEASLYYPRFDRFLEHVVRLLRPDGRFLYADMRYTEEVEGWHRQLNDIGLTLLNRLDITRNVGYACLLDRQRKVALVRRYLPRVCQPLFAEFAGINRDGAAPALPGFGERVYQIFLFHKSACP